MTDEDLIREFAASRSDKVFRQLVERQCDLVLSAARRMTGDPHLAQDVTQRVFCILAAKPWSVPRSVPLTAWLHRTCRTVAIDFMRSEGARRKRESAFFHSLAMEVKPAPDWTTIESVIDTLIDKLPETERRAILMRFYEKRPYGVIGNALGLSEEAVRKRLDRALERLRVLLSKRGVTTTGSALALMLPAHAVTSSAPGLVGTMVSVALASPPVAASALSLLTLTFMNSITKAAIAAACVAAILGTSILIGAKLDSSSRKSGASSPMTNTRASRGLATDSSSSGRLSGSRNESRASTADASDLAELRSIMAGDAGEARSNLLNAYLAKLDAAGAKQALDYIVSLGADYWQDRWSPMEAWAKLEPEKALVWAQKNAPTWSESILKMWTSKDPDSAIAWADANGASLDGNRYYPTIIRSLPDTPDRIEKATQLMLSQPQGWETNKNLSGVLSYMDETATMAWVDRLPENRRGLATAYTVLQLVEKEPVKTLDWLRGSGFFEDRREHSIDQVLQSAVEGGKEDEVSQYIANLPEGDEKSYFQNSLSRVKRTDETSSSEN